MLACDMDRKFCCTSARWRISPPGVDSRERDLDEVQLFACVTVLSITDFANRLRPMAPPPPSESGRGLG